jgi:small-conductance mechanosensitive channel
MSKGGTVSDGPDLSFGGLLPAGLDTWLITAAAVVLAIAVALVGHWIVFAALRRLAERVPGTVDSAAVRYARRPAILIFVVLALLLALPALNISVDADASARRVLSLVLTAAVGWLAFSLTRIFEDLVAARYDIGAADNLQAREAYTRVRMLRRILGMVVIIVTTCLILMTIPSIRQIGVTLFASAGIAGIVAGLAARPTLSNLIAGIQLALTQPIRIDDVVIVEGEWGWIEEIRMTFVVVRIWDLRRLVVPLSYFIETPFQNWTRTTADLLGTVYLHTDYTVPVDEVRKELKRLLEDASEWDRKVWGLQVTDATEKTMELRALMGAHNSGDAWTLRCKVREGLIAFLQREHPDALPRVRTDIAMKDRPSDRERRMPGGPDAN